jgi:hypothetical protein
MSIKNNEFFIVSHEKSEHRDGSEASERAFEYASFLAEKCNTSLFLVNIADVFERVGSSSKKLKEIAKKIEEGEIDDKAMLRKFESQAKRYGIKDVRTIKKRECC